MNRLQQHAHRSDVFGVRHGLEDTAGGRDHGTRCGTVLEIAAHGDEGGGAIVLPPDIRDVQGVGEVVFRYGGQRGFVPRAARGGTDVRALPSETVPTRLVPPDGLFDRSLGLRLRRQASGLDGELGILGRLRFHIRIHRLPTSQHVFDGSIELVDFLLCGGSGRLLLRLFRGFDAEAATVEGAGGRFGAALLEAAGAEAELDSALVHRLDVRPAVDEHRRPCLGAGYDVRVDHQLDVRVLPEALRGGIHDPGPTEVDEEHRMLHVVRQRRGVRLLLS